MNNSDLLVFLALLVGAYNTLVVPIARVGAWRIGNTATETETSTASLGDMNNNEPPQYNRPIRFEPVTVPVVNNNNNNVLKYKAVYSDDDTAVTVADWIRVLSSSSSNGDASGERPNDASKETARTLTEILKKAPYQAFRFETPGMSPETTTRMAFEFVLVRDDALAGFAATPDPNPFAQYLSSSSSSSSSLCKKCDANHYQHSNNNNKSSSSSNACEPTAGCVFANLGGDSTLVSPIDWSSSSPSISSCYGHLANFVRGAPDEQITKLWRLVAETLKEKLLVEVVATTTTATIAAERQQRQQQRQRQRQRQQPLWFSTAGDGVAWLHFRLDPQPKYYHYKPYKVFVSYNQ